MIVVTNRIKVKKGMGAVMAPSFTAPGPLDTSEGFVKVEVLLTQNITEYDELNVNMYWENIDSFTAWRNSDAFKSAHKRPEPGSEAANKESPILGSEIITYEVASVKNR
ncbi:heme-degrading monooxygenase [Paenibacillus sp. J23TS9]|uniref:heme oxygenase n=1 Tax=Paenibacillus sp. J23TS9 TaxID=2807193 RepID=UPI001B108983|nr:heme oxygenase [Paenibacillus sp. J23TS9]GIP29095.1 heme-degrading monooxygenase [Paenibacillus sp. J23TS9]